jgi:hypothetical protein
LDDCRGEPAFARSDRIELPACELDLQQRRMHLQRYARELVRENMPRLFRQSRGALRVLRVLAATQESPYAREHQDVRLADA